MYFEIDNSWYGKPQQLISYSILLNLFLWLIRSSILIRIPSFCYSLKLFFTFISTNYISNYSREKELKCLICDLNFAWIKKKLHLFLVLLNIYWRLYLKETIVVTGAYIIHTVVFLYKTYQFYILSTFCCLLSYKCVRPRYHKNHMFCDH